VKILITGASGMVGRHVTSYLRSMGIDTITTDFYGSDVQGDISDKNFVLSVLSRFDFDFILHLAAITDIKKTIEDPYTCFLVNSYGTLNMLELASVKKVKRFIYASSSNVYGNPRNNPVTEEAPFSPRVPYDYSKVVSEHMVRSYSLSKGIPVSITRSWLLFGEYDNQNRATLRFIISCLKNSRITLFNSGRDVTAPSHALNYARLVYLILNEEKSSGEAYNFGGERPMSIKDYALLIKRLTNSSSEIIYAPPRSKLEEEPLVSYPSIEKAKKKLGYKEILSLEEGLMRTIEWVKKTLV
jgi:UDP-glucose 4-epimerase